MDDFKILAVILPQDQFLAATLDEDSNVVHWVVDEDGSRKPFEPTQDEKLTAYRKYYAREAAIFFASKRTEVTLALAGEVKPDQFAEYTAKVPMARRVLDGEGKPEQTLGPVTVPSETDQIAAEATRRNKGESVQELAASIVVNSYMLLNFGMASSGGLKAAQDAINAAPTMEIAEQIFKAAKQQAEVEIAAYLQSVDQ